jgi:hypothetical protein
MPTLGRRELHGLTQFGLDEMMFRTVFYFRRALILILDSEMWFDVACKETEPPPVRLKPQVDLSLMSA